MTTRPDTRAARHIRPTPSRNPMLMAGRILAPLGVVLILAAMATAQPAKGALVSLGIGAEVLATIVAVAGWISGRGHRFTLRPLTRLGRAALGLFVGGWVLVVLPGLVPVASHAASQVQDALVLLGFLVALASGAVALFAVFTRDERSLPLIAVTLLGGYVSFVFLLAGRVA